MAYCYTEYTVLTHIGVRVKTKIQITRKCFLGEKLTIAPCRDPPSISRRLNHLLHIPGNHEVFLQEITNAELEVVEQGHSH